jgi:hypothetical protein
VVGKQKRVEMRSRFRIWAIASITTMAGSSRLVSGQLREPPGGTQSGG